jgi:hypothetical protein
MRLALTPKVAAVEADTVVVEADKPGAGMDPVGAEEDKVGAEVDMAAAAEDEGAADEDQTETVASMPEVIYKNKLKTDLVKNQTLHIRLRNPHFG